MLASILVFLVIAAVFGFIGRLFYEDHIIETQGVIAIADIIESRTTGGGGSNSSKVLFTLSYIDDATNTAKIITVSNTVPNFYASQLQTGMQVKIKYLKKDPCKLRFIFK